MALRYFVQDLQKKFIEMPGIIFDMLKYMFLEWSFIFQNMTTSSLEYFKILLLSIGWIGGLIFWILRKEQKVPAAV